MTGTHMVIAPVPGMPQIAWVACPCCQIHTITP